MKLSTLIEDVAEIRVPYNGCEILVNYRPDALTPAFLNRIRDQELTLGDYMIEHITTYVQSWDITDDNDKIIPVNAEGVAIIPMSILEEITKAIMDDQKVKKTKLEITTS